MGILWSKNGKVILQVQLMNETILKFVKYFTHIKGIYFNIYGTIYIVTNTCGLYMLKMIQIKCITFVSFKI